MTIPTNRTGLAIVLGALLLAGTSQATPGVERAVRKTEHFELVIDRNQVARLDSLAPLAEELWARLATTTGQRPRKRIRVVFHDEDDYANGWAYAANGWVNIWLVPTPFAMRGGVDWTRDVVSHELAHVFTLQALGLDGHLLSVGAVGSLEGRRSSASGDLLWAPNDLEAWLAEGLAQIGAESCGADSWDGHRDLLERVAWKSGRTLSDGRSRTFWGDARESELAYNQGYSFLRWVLSVGSLDLRALLGSGRRIGLREAIEKAVDRPFPEALDAWREALSRRHGEATWPVETGRAIRPVDAVATWTIESSAIGDSLGTVWSISSRDNDYGIGDLHEWSPQGDRLLASDAVGRLHLSPAGDRLLVLRERTWPDRRTIRDLWTRGTADGRWRRITTRGRVQDADFHADGFAAILREDGRNRAVLLDSLGHLMARLPSPPRGDLVQIASGPLGGLVATTMGADGFRLLALGSDSDSAWTAIDGLPAQARDPLAARGRLWCSGLDGGRWKAYSRGSDGSSRVESESEGAVLAPYPLSDDSLLVSRYQPEGFLACKVARIVDSTSALAPVPLPVPIVFPPPDSAMRVVRLRKVDPLEIGSLVGYGFRVGFLSQDDPSRAFNPGSKWLASASVLASNSTMESSLEAGATMLHGAAGSRAGWDQGVSIQASTEAWSPIVSGGFSALQITLEGRSGDSLADTLFHGDTLPFLSQSELLLELDQQLASKLWGFAYFDQTRLGIGVRRVSGNQSLDLLTTTQIGFGASWRNQQPGRHGVLSGSGASVLVAHVATRTPQAVSAESEAWATQASLEWATHLHRRLFVQCRGMGSWLVPDGMDGQGTAQLGLSLGVPIPFAGLEIPLTRQRRWTFVDPLVRVGHQLDAAPASTGLDDFRLLDRSSFARTITKAPRPLAPFRAGSDLRVLQTSDLEVSWKVLTLSNSASLWTIGVSFPSLEDDAWEKARWSASISL